MSCTCPVHLTHEICSQTPLKPGGPTWRREGGALQRQEQQPGRIRQRGQQRTAAGAPQVAAGQVQRAQRRVVAQRVRQRQRAGRAQPRVAQVQLAQARVLPQG